MSDIRIKDIEDSKLKQVVESLPEGPLKEYYMLFFYYHDRIVKTYEFKGDKLVDTDRIRFCVENICKILFWEYIPQASQYEVGGKIKKGYKWVIKNDNSNDNHTTNLELLTSDEQFDSKLYSYEDKDKPLIVQMIYAILWYENRKADDNEWLYNQIVNIGYKTIYNPCNTSEVHPTPKKCMYTPKQIYEKYFSWLDGLRSICNKNVNIRKRWADIPFPKQNIEFSDIEKEQNERDIEIDNNLQLFDKEVKGFGRSCQYILIAPKELSEPLQKEVSKVRWNMIVCFDPECENSGHLENTLEKSWKEIRNILFKEVTDAGFGQTYWVNANGNNGDEKEYFNYDDWRKNHRKNVVSKIKSIIEKTLDAVVIVDLYCDGVYRDFIKLIYNSDSLSDLSDNGRDITALVVNDSDLKIGENDYNIPVHPVYITEQKLIGYFKKEVAPFSSNTVTSNGRTWPDNITEADINRFKGYGIEAIPATPYTIDKQSSSANRGLSYYTSGTKICWEDLFYHIDVERSCYNNLKKNIKNYIDRGEHFIYYIRQYPCSGATTLVRRLAYDLMMEYYNGGFPINRCFFLLLNELKADSNYTAKYVIVPFAEDKLSNETMLVLVVERTISDDNFNIIQKICNNHNISMIRLVLNDSISLGRKNNILLFDRLKEEEKLKFIEKYRKIDGKPASFYERIEELIEFPLSLTHSENFDVESYVERWLNNLNDEAKDKLTQVFAYWALASKYMMDGNRFIYPVFALPLLGENVNSWWYEITRNKAQEVFDKLFTKERDENGEFTTRIRTKYSLFDDKIMNCSRLNSTEMAFKYIDLISACKVFSDEDKRKYIHNVFLRKSGFEGSLDDKSVNFSDKISPFLKEKIKDPEIILNIFKKLKDVFPEDDYCLAHYAQLLYNKAYYVDKDKYDSDAFEEAEKTLYEISQKKKDAAIEHSLGVLFYRKIGVLRNGDIDDKALKIAKALQQLCEEHCDESVRLLPSDPHGLVTKAQMIKAVINIGKVSKKKEDYEFCEEDPDFEDLVIKFNETCRRIAKYCPDDENVDASTAQLIKMYEDLISFSIKLNGGDGKKVYRRYADKIGKAKNERLRKLYGNKMYDALLFGKPNQLRNKISKIDDDDLKEIETALHYNSQHKQMDAYEKLFYLYVFNNRTKKNINDAISLLKDWSKNSPNKDDQLWSNYYLSICYAARTILNGKSLSNSKELFDEAIRKTQTLSSSKNLDRPDYVPYYYLKNSNDGLQFISESRSNADYFEGRVTSVNYPKRNKGKAKLSCGLEVSFSAKNNFDETDIGKTIIKGRIGFRFIGLGFYDIQRVSGNEEDNESDIAEVEQNQSDITNNDSLDNTQQTVDNLSSTRNDIEDKDTKPLEKDVVNTTDVEKDDKKEVCIKDEAKGELLPRLKIVGKINLDDVPKSKKSIVKPYDGEELEGVIDVKKGKVYVEGQQDPFQIDKKDGYSSYSKEKKIDFESETHVKFNVKVGENYNTGGPFYYATNIRPIDDDEK